MEIGLRFVLDRKIKALLYVYSSFYPIDIIIE